MSSTVSAVNSPAVQSVAVASSPSSRKGEFGLGRMSGYKKCQLFSLFPLFCQVAYLYERGRELLGIFFSSLSAVL